MSAALLAPPPPPRGSRAAPPRATRPGGFTLVELLIALALIGLLGALALPGTADALAAREARAAAESLGAALALARAEALRRGARVEVCPAPAGAVDCATGAWGEGWIVRPAEAPVAADAAVPVLARQGRLRHGVGIAANRPLADYVSFTPAGHPRRHDGALQMGSFTICRPGLAALRLVLANSGRTRIEPSREVCA